MPFLRLEGIKPIKKENLFFCFFFWWFLWKERIDWIFPSRRIWFSIHYCLLSELEKKFKWNEFILWGLNRKASQSNLLFSCSSSQWEFRKTFWILGFSLEKANITSLFFIKYLSQIKLEFLNWFQFCWQRLQVFFLPKSKRETWNDDSQKLSLVAVLIQMKSFIRRTQFLSV